MSKIKSRFTVGALQLSLLLICSLLGGCGGKSPESNSSARQEALFLDATDEAPNDEQTTDTDGLSVRKRFVRVNETVLKRQAENIPYGETVPLFSRLHLNLFDDENVEVVLEQAQKVSDKNIIFTGHITEDSDSAVTLVLNDHVLVANVRRGDSTESYEVRYASGGIHAISQRRDDSEDDCEAVEGSTVASHSEEAALGENDSSEQASPVIDILGAYTPNARIKLGGTSGIVALIQLGIADTNRALSDSGSSLRVRLVGTMQLKRNESGNWSRDLSALKGKTDGRWDEVHAERARLGADQVSVVATYPNGSGVAGIGYIRATSTTAFTIVKHSSFSKYTFSHELGHNLGLRHTDGYVNSSGRFRTIIAYGTYPRIRRYSNPKLTYNQYRTGDNRHNEVAIINQRASTVAGLISPRVVASEAEGSSAGVMQLDRER